MHDTLDALGPQLNFGLTAIPLAIGWFVKTALSKEGHELLTRTAAKGLSKQELDALIRGVRAPDVNGPITNHIKLKEQRRHALRQTLGSKTRKALGEAVGHLHKLHGNALAARARPKQLEIVGEALHLIQDSFSPAHVQRKGRKIKKLRNYGPANWTRPWEDNHGFPMDSRDNPKDKKGNLNGPARSAVAASSEYLVLVARHVKTPPSVPQRKKDLDAFTGKWLAM